MNLEESNNELKLVLVDNHAAVCLSLGFFSLA